MATKKSAKKVAASRAKAKTPARRAPAKPAAAPRRRPGALRLVTATPFLTVNDIGRSLTFYRDVLGFVVTERWEKDGQLRGVELSAGDVTFGLNQDDWQKGRDRVKGVGFRIYCDTRQDVDLLAAAVKARGGTLDAEPRTEAWGRFFGFTDPDGFKVTIVNERKRRAG
jgi:uncharacterized glyoxalase superfamily protein PhnB